MVSRQRIALAVVPAIALAGCVHRPLDFGPRGPARSAEELLRRVADAEAAVSSVTGEASLFIDGPGGKGSTALYVEAAAPASIHLEQLDFFGRPQSVLVSDGARFGLYDAQTGRYFRGPASPENLARFVPVALPLDELTALLLGRVPRWGDAADAPSLDERRRVYLLHLARGRLTQVLEVEIASARVVHSRVEGAPAGYDVELTELEPSGGAIFPKRLALQIPRQHTRLELTWKALSLNHPVAAESFEATPPEGIPVTELDAEGRSAGP